MAVKNAVAKTWFITPGHNGVRWSTHPDGDRVSISWDTVEGAVAYRRYQGTASGVYGAPTELGDVTTTLFTPAPGTYFWAITALDAEDDESEFSTELTATVPT